MKKAFFLSIAICTIVCSTTFAQSTSPIQLDRPDQTECPYITPSKFIQIETGVALENNRKSLKSYSIPSVLWKYGVNEKFELRLITEFLSEQINKSYTSGFAPVTIGFKTALLEEQGIVPKISFIGHLTPGKLGSENFQTSYVAPSFRFTMQHVLSEKVTLAYNLGAEWDGESAAHTNIYTLTTGISLGERLGCFTELYGYMADERYPDHRFDCGLTYLINNDCMVDLAGGFGINKISPDNYLTLGFSYRFATGNQD